MFNGIDVSRHQHIIDWDKVKPQVDFAMLRAGFGNGNIDAQAARNIKECERLDIPFGLYWFSYALSPEMAEKEAEHLIGIVGKRKIPFPLVYDFEYDSVNYATKNGVKINRQFVIACTDAFCSRLERAGFYAMFYCNKDYYERYYRDSICEEKYDIWYANYSNQPLDKAHIWQTTDKGRIDGIVGRVDLDKSDRNYPVIMSKNDLNNY